MIGEARDPRRPTQERQSIYRILAKPLLDAVASFEWRRKGPAMWENITPGDIEQAKHSLNMRRAETLSRHAEELKALDTEQSEVDNLVSAIQAFMSKYRGGASSETKTEIAAAEAPNSAGVVNSNFEVHENSAQASTRYGMVNFRAFG